MIQRWKAGDGAKQAYEAYAAAYDDFNRDYKYERWTGRLLEKAEAAGLRGNRLLDVACGTGLSFLPLLERGWQVTGCDISPAMLEIAREKVGERAELVAADMRELPELGEFDLVWAVNDPLNYLLSTEEFEAAMAGMRRNLAPGGLALFDVNTVITYRTFFSSEVVVEEKGRHFVWQGQLTPEEVLPGVVAEARFETTGEPDSAHVHRQRHFGEAEVLAAIAAAEMHAVAVYGELDGDLNLGLEEEVHTKAVYVCRRA